MFMDFCVKTEDSLLMARNMSSSYEEIFFAETRVFGGNQTDINH
jgi:hypothetical protein